MDQKKIGKFLKTLRGEKGITQEQLAEHFHTTSRSVSRWETGSSLPDISLLVDLADFYDVDVREIIDGERKTDMMDVEVREVADKMADYAGSEKNKLLRSVQIIGVSGVFISLVSLILQVLSYQPDLKRALGVLASFIALILMSVLTLYVTGVLNRIAKRKQLVSGIKIATVVMLIVGAIKMLQIAIAVGIMIFSVASAKPQVMTDPTTYSEMADRESKSEYALPHSDLIDLLPASIDVDEVREYQYTYYNPWDAQYVFYMTIDYDEASYEEELARLQDIGISGDYTDYYSVTGEPEGYDLLAMNCDYYNGFVYAIVPEDSQDGDHSITYVTIYFCNYFLDLDIHEYMKDEYLLEGFDATDDNPYSQQALENMK